MNTYRFNTAGKQRKELVSALSELTNTSSSYLGTPSYAYEVGAYRIDRDGTVTGAYDEKLFATLAQRGFKPEAAAAEPEAAAMPQEEPEPNLIDTPDQEASPEDIDRLTVEVPLEGFTPEALDNLTKMTLAKEALLKKALDTEELPIRLTNDTIQFPWFQLKDLTDAACYTQFIHALCKTAKQKKRVTAKPPAAFENESFAMRIWLIGLGMIGAEYKEARKLMGWYLSGNSAWRYGKPEKAPKDADTAPERNAVETDAETPEEHEEATEDQNMTITDEIFNQIMAIRDEGAVNMMDAIAVQRISLEKGFHSLVVFIEEHKALYAEFILFGKRG
jgi:hypothetical protein